MNADQAARLKELNNQFNESQQRYDNEYARIRKARPGAGSMPLLATSTTQALSLFSHLYRVGDRAERAKLLDPDLQPLAAELVLCRMALDTVYADAANDELETATTWRERADASGRYSELCSRLAFLESLADALGSNAQATGPLNIYQRSERAFKNLLAGKGN